MIVLIGMTHMTHMSDSAQANYYRAFNLGSVEVYDPYAEAFTNGGWQVIGVAAVFC